MREHAVRVGNVIRQEAEFLRRMVVDEAYWDTAYEFAGNPAHDGFARDVTDGTFADGRISAMILTDRSGRMLLGRGFDLESETPVPLNQALIAKLAELQALLEDASTDKSVAGLLFVEPYPLLVAAAQILKTDGTGPTRGMLLYAREFNPDKIERLGDVLRLDLVLDDRPLEGETVDQVVIHRHADTLTGRLYIPDLLGRAGGVLNVMVERSLYHRGQRGVRYFLSWTLASSLLFGVVAYGLLNRLGRLSQQEAKHYRLLFNGSPIPMWVYDVESLRFIDVNAAATAQYGYTRDEFLQKTILDLRSPEDADAVRKGVEQLVRESAAGGQHPRPVGTWSHLRKDGTHLLVDVSVVLFELHGRLAVLASALDITDKVANEQALSISEERYRQLFHYSPLPMWVVDLDTLRYLDVNQTAIDKYGFSRDEFLGMTIMDIRPPEDVDLLQQALPSARNGRSEQGVWRHRCKDGRTLEVEIVLRDIPYEGRQARLVMANDITEKERLRNEAEQVSRLAALGELSAGVAHEINNPNGMIQINLQLVADVWADLQPILQQRLQEDPGLVLGGLAAKRLQTELPQVLDEMLTGTHRIRDIVEDLKDFARHQDQTLEELVDVNQIVEAAERMVNNQIKKSGADYRVQLTADLPAVQGNFRQLEQVLINLLVNACQALEGSGRRLVVSTRLDQSTGEVVIEVADGGRGIEAKTLRRITEPFFTTRREEGGTGLGLSVSSRIVRNHGGRLQFESRPGQGTRAELRLPAAGKEIS